mmetsp:Transcript_25799/g.74497  ORF Transcript_25799/g.74497 Transcript_25799/m.74497 type:complete len:307 (+) Transcript_25799:1651-2571(+)
MLPNQACGTSMPHSRRYFAMIEALATSRNWKTTLFRSAMRSKLCVKSSAYFTRGWSGRVRGASSKPSLPMICSRASTPIFKCGTRTRSPDRNISAFLTTNHSRAAHSASSVSRSEWSSTLFMPTTGWVYSPNESSFRWKSAWNMTSPTLVPASHSGSKRFNCIADSGDQSLTLPLSTGSRENSGSRPSLRRTWSAMARYSRFTAAAGSKVAPMRIAAPSSSETRQHMPWGTSVQPTFTASSEFLGIHSALQPMSNSSRRVCFSACSDETLSCSCLRRSRSSNWALHSPWRMFLPTLMLAASASTER